VRYSSIGPIAIHLPDRVETNDELQAQFPRWDMKLIAEKTGVQARHIAAEGELASDLGVTATKKLLHDFDIDPQSIDFLLLCTQTPDYPLPTTACLMQDRLGLRTDAGALDFNLGCSGFVYGLSLADGLIRTGSVRRVLLVTAETYSKYIDPTDRSLRTIFGDGAAATLIDAADEPTLGAFKYGTDGSGANTLLVTRGGNRPQDQVIKPRHRHRWPSALYMDGPGLIQFAVDSLPGLVDDVLAAAELTPEQVDHYIFHQATAKMMDELCSRLGIASQKMPIVMAHCGNTVSSTIPIVIEAMRRRGDLRVGMNNLLVGFGVGWSWAGCMWRESWAGG